MLRLWIQRWCTLFPSVTLETMEKDGLAGALLLCDVEKISIEVQKYWVVTQHQDDILNSGSISMATSISDKKYSNWRQIYLSAASGTNHYWKKLSTMEDVTSWLWCLCSVFYYKICFSSKEMGGSIPWRAPLVGRVSLITFSCMIFKLKK